MPTYLCHGFRWDRRSIRVFVVVQNIDDAAPEWIIAPNSSPAILESFYSLFDFLPEPIPDETEAQRDKKKRNKSKASKAAALRNEYDVPPSTVPPEEDDVLQNDWSAVKLLEEYDPTDLSYVSRPYAYVADHVVRIDLSNSITEEIVRYEERLSETKAMASAPSDEFYKAKKGSSGKKAGWFEKLRDQLQRGEDIRWYIVVCGDEVRDFPEDMGAARAQEDEIAREAENATPRPRDRSAGPSRGGTSPREYMSSVPASQFATAMSPQQQQSQQISPKEAGLPYGTLPQHPNMVGNWTEKETPTLQAKPSMDFRPKTPKSGGFRRLFGKKSDDP